MYDEPKDMLEALRAAPEMYRHLLASVTEEQARAATGGDEDWSVIEVMCHLRDAEERTLERVRLMLKEDNPVIEGYDQAQWAVERKYSEQSLADALQAFLRFREERIAALESLSPEEWQRAGRHTEVGPTSISNSTLHMIAHDFVHAAQIARQLSSE